MLFWIGSNLLEPSITFDRWLAKTKIKEAEKLEKYTAPFMWIPSFTDVLLLIISFMAMLGPNRNCLAWFSWDLWSSLSQLAFRGGRNVLSLGRRHWWCGEKRSLFPERTVATKISGLHWPENVLKDFRCCRPRGQLHVICWLQKASHECKRVKASHC